MSEDASGVGITSIEEIGLSRYYEHCEFTADYIYTKIFCCHANRPDAF
jgi:hypothetical protein